MKTISSKALAILAGALCMVWVYTAQAGEARYTDVVLSDAKDGKPKQVFGPATDKIYLKAKLTDVPSGARLKGAWIAEKTKVAPANYQIDATELKVGTLMNRVDFSLSKPNKGWPVGDYRVDLSINDKVVQSVKFQISP